ncbi:o-succinylbenzoate--CoA ligase [Celerinatantimonas sp. YJH-8]|uniref:o-succinylbenzoate--CoA ligase n=1 Tax=Celerinatantimonas sp. YJH-8 TaxID=3228714 RepID=UPI0038BFD996
MQSPLFQQAIRHPTRIAVEGDQECWSYHHLACKVAALLQQLQQLPLPPQSRIGWIANHPLHGLLLQQACLHGRWVFCAISPHFRAEQRRQAIDTFQLTILVDDLSTPTAATKLRTIALDFSATAKHFDILDITLDPKQWVDMVLTSGSSGAPKAVIHSWQNLYYSALGSNKLIPLTSDDNWLASLPLFHVGGQALIWRCLLAGARLTFSQLALEPTLNNHAITHLSLVPTQLYRLLPSADFHSQQLALRHILIGGGSCNEARLLQTQQRGFQCYMSYGSSEMSSQIATRIVGQGQGAGKLLDYRELKLENGEICLRGQTLSPGYFQSGILIAITDPQGWYHSHDIGHYAGGNLIVHGRIDNMFICGGENIQPEEIETILLNHPDILTATVVAQNDQEYGARPVAFIQQIKNNNHYDLDCYLKSYLSAFKRPVRYYQLPQQASLKVQRKLLQQWANRPTDYSIVEIE